MSESQVTPPVPTGTQALSLDDTQVRTDLLNVLANIQQNSVELGALLQHQPHLIQELGALASGEVLPQPVPTAESDTEPTLELPTSSQQLPYGSSSSSLLPNKSSSLAGQLLAGQSLPAQMLLGQPLPEQQSGPVPSRPTVYKEQDRFLPIHNVARIMRNSIALSGKVSKEAKECMQECVSEFISFLTSEASDRCLQEKRKTITGDDILCAMATLGFDNYIEPMKMYLQNYREYNTKVDKVPDTSQPTVTAIPSTVQDVSRTMSINELIPPPTPPEPPIVPVSSVLVLASNPQPSPTSMQ